MEWDAMLSNRSIKIVKKQNSKYIGLGLARQD